MNMNRSKNSNSMKDLDAIEYYRNYLRDDEDNYSDYNDGGTLLFQDLMGECYICLSKLLRTELRLFDRRDSFVIRHSLSISKR